MPCGWCGINNPKVLYDLKEVLRNIIQILIIYRISTTAIERVRGAIAYKKRQKHI